MNYIYDILINFQDYLIDIFEWNLDDEIIHIRKIPLFKIEKDLLLKIINNEIELDIYNKIHNKTEIFTNKNVRVIDYACLLSDGDEVIALKLNKKGLVLSKSKLLIDEEEEVLEYCEAIEKININYKIIKKENINHFKTRKELKISNYIYKELEKSLKNKDYDKIKYLYYECFRKEENNIDKIIKTLKRTIEKDLEKSFKIYSFFKMTTSK